MDHSRRIGHDVRPRGSRGIFISDLDEADFAVPHAMIYQPENGGRKPSRPPEALAPMAKWYWVRMAGIYLVGRRYGLALTPARAAGAATGTVECWETAGTVERWETAGTCRRPRRRNRRRRALL